MDILGRIRKLTRLLFPSNGNNVIVQPKSDAGQAVTDDVIFELPISDNATHELVAADLAQTITNKTIDVDNNTVSNIENDNIKTGAAIDAAKIHDGSVSNTEFGYIGSLTSDAQAQIDSKADSSALTAHESDTTTHGTTGDIVGTSDIQTLTNKTIDADNNTITNIENDNIKAAAAIDATKIHDGSVSNTEFGFLANVTSDIQAALDAAATDTDLSNHEADTSTHGVTSTIVGTTEAQTLTNKTIDADNNTVSNIGTDELSDNGVTTAKILDSNVTGAKLEDNIELPGTEGFVPPKGTAAQRPGTPTAGEIRFNTDASILELYDGSSWDEIGAGGAGGASSGVLNLNTNPNAEIATDNGVTDDIGDYIDSGAGTTSSRTVTSSEIPLYPFKSTAIKLVLASGTSDYTRLRFQVPEAYRGVILGIGWDQLVSGLLVEDIKVELYNYSDNYVTGETEVPLFSDDTSGDTFVSIVDGFFSSSFAPTSGREYYELRWINNGATTGSLFMNEILVFSGAPETTSGITTPTAYTPDTEQGWTSITSRLEYSHLGKYCRIQGDFDVATVNGDTARLYLPTGLVINWQDVTVDTRIVGFFERDIASTNVLTFPALASHGANYIEIGYRQQGTSRNGLIAQPANTVGVNGDRWTVNILVPINLDFSTLTATEAKVQNSSIRVHSSTLVVSGTPTLVNFSTTGHNDGGGFSYSGGQVTCLFDGKVSAASVLEAASGSGGATITAQIYKNGTSIAQNQYKDSAFVSVSDPAIKVSYGDVLEIRASSSATPTLAATSDGTYFSISRIPDRSAQGIGFPFLGDTTTGTKEAGMVVKQSATSDIGAAPSQTDFNNLLQKLRDAGILDT